MANLSDLGQLVKQKYPGAYDQLDDASLGAMVQAKHPGAYDKFGPASDVGESGRQSVLAKVGDKMDRDPDYIPGDHQDSQTGLWANTKQALSGFNPVSIWSNYANHMNHPYETSSYADGSISDVVPAGPAMHAADQALSGDLGGAAGTIAGTGAGFVATHYAIKGAGKAIEKTAEALPDVRNNAADGLRSSAEKNIYAVLNPTTRANKALVQNKIAPALVERKVTATSLKNLRDQAEAKADEHGAKIDTFFDDHADSGTKLSPKPIMDALEAERQAHIVDGTPINSTYVDRLQSLKDQLAEVSKANGGDIPLGSLRRIRQIHDEIVAQSKGGGGYALPPDAQSSLAASRKYANSIRSTLADNYEELAKDNKEFNLWNDTRDVADATLQRKVGQSNPLTRTIMENTGTAIGAYLGGPEGAVAGRYGGHMLASLQRSALWNTFSASMKSRIADLIQSGDEQGALQLIDHGLNPEYADRRRAALEQEAAPRDAEPGTQVGQIPGGVPDSIEQQALREAQQVRKPQSKIRANTQPPQQRTLGIKIKAAGFGEEIPGAIPGQQSPSRPSGLQPLRNGAQNGPPRRIVDNAGGIDPEAVASDGVLEQQALRESRLFRKPQAKGLSKKKPPTMMAVGGHVGRALRSGKRSALK